MKRGTCKGSIKPRKKRKVEESPKKSGKQNERDSEIGEERDVCVEGNVCLRSEYSVGVERLKDTYRVELKKWLISKKTRSCKGPVKESEKEREEERQIFSSLLESDTEKEREISGLMEAEECEKNGGSEDVRRSNKEGDGKVESQDEEEDQRGRRKL